MSDIEYSSDSSSTEEKMDPDNSDDSDIDDKYKVDEAQMDDDDDDGANDAKLLELEKKVQSNPFLYDDHIQLIGLARKMGELDTLREARANMSKYFPLSPDLWIQWINDEKKFIDTKEDRVKIVELFEKAVKDYTSVPLWLEYCTFSISSMDDSDSGGSEALATLFERGLSAVGLHVTGGAALWDTYRETQLALLARLQGDELSSVGNKTVQDRMEKQMQKIDSLFTRQLKIPLQGMQSTMDEYIDFVGSDKTSVDAEYQKALGLLDKLLPYEDKIEASALEGDEVRLSAYISYLDFEMSRKEPARIQTLFERAITDHCLKGELWYKYIDYLEDKLPFENTLAPVYRRAVRNCPWYGAIWLRYVEAIERWEKEYTDILTTYQEALSAGIAEQNDMLQLWISYCDCARRKLDSVSAESEKETRLAELRLIFEKAIEHLFQHYGKAGDPTCILYRYWAFVEAKYANNLEKSRTIWAEVMKLDHGNEAEMWLEYLNFERRFGDPKHCRRVLGRAVNSVTDDPEAVFRACLVYEREEGTLESLRDAKSKVNAQRHRIAQRNPPAAKAGKEKEKAKPQQKERSGHNTGVGQAANNRQSSGKKRPAQEHSIHDEPDTKKRPVEKDSDGFAIPNSQSARKPGQQQDTRGSEEGVGKWEEKPAFVPPEDLTGDARTVFISNLDYNTEDPAIKAVLSKCGDIEEIRLVRDYRGRSKGFGFVRFSSESSRAVALSLDRTPIGDRPMFVSPPDPTKRHNFQFPTGRVEKCKLFVKNLPKHITKHALETIFAAHGKLRDVRIATYRNGQPKGHAYVEYVEETDASRAIIKADNLQVGDCQISVCLSNPPPRRQPDDMGTNPTPSASLGAGKRLTTDHGNARTQVSLMPRALQTRPSTSGQKPVIQTTSGSAGNITDSSRKSNDDFRKMFFK